MKLEKLSSPGFLLALLLLLTNDFIFKPTFHNFITGKLSDFAGLFVFPIFWLALFPNRKKIIYFLTAFLFIFWKSAYSQVLIDTWNSLELLNISRVVDYTNLFALLILPISYYYDEFAILIKTSRLAYSALISISLFAFIATSYARPEHFYENKDYYFDFSKQELVKRMNYMKKECIKRSIEVEEQRINEEETIYNITFCSRLCRPYQDKTTPIVCHIVVKREQEKSSISLISIPHPYVDKNANHDCRNATPKRKDKKSTDDDQKQFLLHIFEKEFIDRLKYGRFED